MTNTAIPTYSETSARLTRVRSEAIAVLTGPGERQDALTLLAGIGHELFRMNSVRGACQGLDVLEARIAKARD
jgi:hypothetical protein